ncbi:hydrogenase [Gammaproteobacteria bacterium ESL0073]|nr:hydrogenase [Gammaproteobacteria bacterium ESL0073]
MVITAKKSLNTIDLISFNQTIYDCLDNINALSDSLNIDQINIIIETQIPATLIVTSINTKTRQKEVWSQALSENEHTFRCPLSDQPIHYNDVNYKSLFEDLIPNNFFYNIQLAYHVPLYWTEHQQSAIQFLRNQQANRFSSKEVENLKQLASLVEKVIAGLFNIAHLSQEKASLDYELLKNHILVEVTDAAISLQGMEEMAKIVSKDIIKFCNLDYIGILLCPNENNQKIHLYDSHRSNNKQLNQKHHLINAQEPLAQELLKQNSIVTTSIEELAEKYPDNDQLSTMLDKGLQTLCAMPLKFGSEVYGALLLAHSTSEIFDLDTISLFRQIADRVVIAAKNIYSYQKVTNLNHSLTNENLYLSETIQQIDTFGEIIGSSPAVQKALEQVEMVAHSGSSVLLLGETGTGKELFAKAIHNRSPRHDKRMIKVNCSAVPANLLESELFGHERGAFTGANTRRIGRFELAQGSSLLLDEIGDIPLELQPKLLRVLQEREIERLGGNTVIPVDVRIISATNCNLEKMIDDKTFRADLFYRLNVFPIIIPPLRERKTDIPLLAQFFTQKFAKLMKRDIDSIAANTLNQLCDYHWPGNVRELANVIERAVILNKGNVLSIDPQSFLLIEKNTPQEKSTPQPTVIKKLDTSDPDNEQREQILRVLKETNGIIAGPKGAAIRLGLKRTTLLSRMQRLGISPKDVIQDD